MNNDWKNKENFTPRERLYNFLNYQVKHNIDLVKTDEESIKQSNLSPLKTSIIRQLTKYPGYNYLGPNTLFTRRFLQGTIKPFNKLDEFAMMHDDAYYRIPKKISKEAKSEYVKKVDDEFLDRIMKYMIDHEGEKSDMMAHMLSTWHAITGKEALDYGLDKLEYDKSFISTVYALPQAKQKTYKSILARLKDPDSIRGLDKELKGKYINPKMLGALFESIPDDLLSNQLRADLFKDLTDKNQIDKPEDITEINIGDENKKVRTITIHKAPVEEVKEEFKEATYNKSPLSTMINVEQEMRDSLEEIEIKIKLARIKIDELYQNEKSEENDELIEQYIELHQKLNEQKKHIIENPSEVMKEMENKAKTELNALVELHKRDTKQNEDKITNTKKLIEEIDEEIAILPNTKKNKKKLEKLKLIKKGYNEILKSLKSQVVLKSDDEDDEENEMKTAPIKLVGSKPSTSSKEMTDDEKIKERTENAKIGLKFVNNAVAGSRFNRADYTIAPDNYTELTPEEHAENALLMNNLNFVLHANANAEILPTTRKQDYKVNNRLLEAHQFNDKMRYNGKLNMGDMYIHRNPKITEKTKKYNQVVMIPSYQNTALRAFNPLRKAHNQTVGVPILFNSNANDKYDPSPYAQIYSGRTRNLHSSIVNHGTRI